MRAAGSKNPVINKISICAILKYEGKTFVSKPELSWLFEFVIIFVNISDIVLSNSESKKNLAKAKPRLESKWEFLKIRKVYECRRPNVRMSLL